MIDVQNDFVNGSLGSNRSAAILPHLYHLLDTHDWPLIIASQGKKIGRLRTDHSIIWHHNIRVRKGTLQAIS